MADQSRQTDDSVISHLRENGTGYDFFQAVEQIMLHYPEKTPIGYDGPPQKEALAFTPTAKFTFASSDIAAIKTGTPGYTQPVTVETTFLSLYGRDGVLPWHYTSQLRKEKKEFHKEGMKSFLDIFNHRTISYFYRAGMKYRLPHHYRPQTDNPVFSLFAAFTGTATRGLAEALPEVKPGIFKYASLFSIPRSSESIEQMLNDLFAVPVTVDEFVGEWVRIQDEARTVIGRSGQNSTIGVSMCIGKKTWSTQHKFRVTIGPLTYEQYCELIPGTDKFRQLEETIRLFVSVSLLFEIRYTVLKHSLPRMQAGNRTLFFGKNMWLTSMDRSFSEETVVRTAVLEDTF